MKKKTIYIPMEIKAREFVSQTLLAGKIAEAGGRVYIGSKRGISKALLIKPGCGGTLLYKGGMEDPIGFKELRKCLDAVAVLDQEMSPNQEVLRPAERFLRKELDFVDRLYFVGEDHANAMLASCPDLPPHKVKVSGWPRVDLWGSRYAQVWESEAEKLRRRFGSFVLFSSDFGVLDEGDSAWRVERELATPWELRLMDSIPNLRESFTSAVHEFRQIVKFLVSFDREPSFPAVVVRPHPAENHSIWVQALKETRKTQVIFEGDITPWLHASVALLHRGCTTAMQAEILGKPTGFLLTAESGRRKEGAQRVSHSKPIASVGDGLDLVNADYRVPKTSIGLSRIASIDGTASELIAADLLALTAQPEEKLPPIWRAAFRGPVLSRLFRKIFRRCVKFLHNTGFSIPTNVVVNKTRGGFGADEVRDVLGKLGMDHLSAREAMKDLVCIERL